MSGNRLDDAFLISVINQVNSEFQTQKQPIKPPSLGAIPVTWRGVTLTRGRGGWIEYTEAAAAAL